MNDTLKRALIIAPVIMIVGSLIGGLSGSGDGDWYASLQKPSFQPPGWAFGVVWPILYAMQGVALAIILGEPESRERNVAIGLFAAQLALNFLWSPVFFAWQAITPAKWLIYAIAVLAAITAGRFWRMQRLAGALMLPYLAWLIFAATLNGAIEQLNPGAGSPLFG